MFRSRACTDWKPAVSRDRVFHAQRLRFLEDVVVAIAGVRVVAQPLRSAGSALLLDRPEHVRHLARVVSRARHDLRPLEIGLLLVLAAESQERRAETELGPLRDGAPRAPADNRAEHGPDKRADFVRRGLRGLRGPVPQRHVADLVREDARHFPFALGRLDHPAVDVHRAARQRERVDLPHVDDLERVLELGMPLARRNPLHQPASDVRHVRGHGVVAEERQLLLDLDGGLAAELDVLLRRVLVLGRVDDGLRGQNVHRHQHGDDSGSETRHSHSGTPDVQP